MTGTPPFNPNSEGTKGESSNPKEASDSIEKWANKNIVSKFAITLYFRWILRSLQKINLPLPPINKQQIYSSSGLAGCNFSPTIIDPNIGAQITSTITCALNMLEAEVEQKSIPSLPGVASFKTKTVGNGNLQVECLVPDNSWKHAEKGAWKCMTLYDLVSYFFYTENYLMCRKYLKSVKSIQANTVEKVVNTDVLNGFSLAVGMDLDFKDDSNNKKGKDDKTNLATDEIVDVLKKIEGSNGIESSLKGAKDVPYYRRINSELAAVSKGGGSNSTTVKAIEKLVEANISMRYKDSLPQNAEFFRTGHKIVNSGGILAKQKDQKLFLQYLSGVKKLDYSKEPIDVTVDKPWNKIKHTKLKKRDLILSILREMQKPEKIYKLLQDLGKMTANSVSATNPLYIQRLIPRYTNLDGGQIVELYASASSGASISQQHHDTNYLFILMAKLKQLVDLKAYDETSIFYSTIEKHVGSSCTDKRQANILLQHVRMQVLYTKMLQFGDERYDLEQAVDENKKKMKSGSSNTNSTLASELSKQLKECLIFLAESAQENVLGIQIGSIYLLETAFVTLLNLGEFFVLKTIKKSLDPGHLKSKLQKNNYDYLHLLGEFEFVLGSCGKEGAGPSGKLYRFRNLVQIVSLVSSAVLHIQNQQKQLQAGSRLNTTNAANRANAEDFKKTCRGLSDILLPCVEVSLTATKRGRGGSDVGSNPNKATKDSASARAWLVRFLKRLNHPEILTLLASFFISVYNMTVEDSSHEIQLGSSGSDLGLPVLPMNLGTSSEINEDSVLHLITAISIKGSKNALTQGIPWARIQAEVNFAQGNYLAALRFYIQSLMLTTHYFQKPWTKDSITSINIAATTAGENLGTSLPQPNQSTGFSVPTGFSSAGPSSANLLSSGGNGWDDRIFHKMIKCTSELGHHATTVVLCQFLGTDSADYPTAFRSLEDRGSNDCMDDMYPFLWDVTALEYTVNMHTKRGELSRKRKALETISQLEINTNNNEEILREARATRRSAFLRYMAAAFL